MPEIVNEHSKAAELAAAKQSDRTRPNQARVPAADKPAGGRLGFSAGGIGVGTWFVLFAGTALVTAISALISFITGFLGFAINYGVVLMLWIWAKSKGLKSPTFTSNLKRGGGAASSVGTGPAKAAGGATEKAGAALEGVENALPANDLIFTALGGISPTAYVFGLWMNNR